MDDEKLREYADACFASCYPPVDAVVQAILAERERASQRERNFASELMRCETEARDLRHDDATRRGYAFACQLFRAALSTTGGLMMARTETAQKQPTPTDSNVNETATDAG